ncbi:excinuclease ABC subunit C [Rosistilla carotiformis]|uniref:Excinuclease ABC subunit C n=1 Tax=Rosistilla carotiformis TaxID=2528017 RepID=A0A518JS14_9BACT|nr:GIY-YIG nuclease family protein [Rosistilla carotiformis]QDV68326.1 excinuclease ABC subunit C [Rosistilla carotiformis]
MRNLTASLLLFCLPAIAVAQTPSELSTIVIDAFAKSSDGWSSDEVLLDDARRARFLAAVRTHRPDADETTCNLMLLKLRKSGKLTVKATRRGKPADDRVLPIAEIAARTIMEKFDIATDTMIADPMLRQAFDAAALTVDSDVSLYDVRKAAFQLRKSRRLKPELVLRVADWEKEVVVKPLAEVRADLKVVPTLPGVYLFRDQTGYIYIGEAANLRVRLTQHLTDSDRRSLADYIQQTAVEGLSIEWHAFPKTSPARQVAVRRAYESELIRSRNPRLNVRP